MLVKCLCLAHSKGVMDAVFLYTPMRCFPSGSSRKESACQLADAGDLGSIPGWERCPGGGNGNLLQYSCLENPMIRGAWQATVHGVAELYRAERLSLNSLMLPVTEMQRKQFLFTLPCPLWCLSFCSLAS